MESHYRALSTRGKRTNAPRRVFVHLGVMLRNEGLSVERASQALTKSLLEALQAKMARHVECPHRIKYEEKAHRHEVSAWSMVP